MIKSQGGPSACAERPQKGTPSEDAHKVAEEILLGRDYFTCEWQSQTLDASTSLSSLLKEKTGGRSPAYGRGSVRVDLAQAPSSQRMSRAREATRQCQPLQIQSLQRWSRNHGPAYKWQRRANTLFHTLCPSSLEPAESSPSVKTCMLQEKATARARRAVVMLFVMNLKLALEYMTPRLSAGFSCRKQHQASKVKKK